MYWPSWPTAAKQCWPGSRSGRPFSAASEHGIRPVPKAGVTVMEYRAVGSSGLRVSQVGLGCNNFGRQCDLDTSRDIVRAALDAGVTFFDRQRLRSWPVGGVPRPGPPRPAQRGRHRHQVRGARQRRWRAAVGQSHPGRHSRRRRRIPAQARHRLHRLVPAALAGPGHGDRRDPGRPGPDRLAGQGALPRPLELRGRPDPRGARPGACGRLGGVHLVPEPLQPAPPHHRERSSPGLRGLRPQPDPVLPPGQRLPPPASTARTARRSPGRGSASRRRRRSR